MALNQGKYWYLIFNSSNLKSFLGFRAVSAILTIIVTGTVRFANVCKLTYLLAIGLHFVNIHGVNAQTFKKINLQEINDLILKVQEYRATYTNYQVRFWEVTKRGVLIGDLYYAKPNKLRINYYRGKLPITEVYLGDDKLIVYFITSDIVYEQENFNTVSDVTSKAAGSLDYLLEKYNFNFKSSKDPVQVFAEEDYKKFNLTKIPNQLSFHLGLTPKDVSKGLDNLEIWIAAKQSLEGEYLPTQILRSKTISITGNTSDIYFAPIEINQQFSADVFTFVVPAHVRIVKNFLPVLDL